MRNKLKNSQLKFKFRENEESLKEHTYIPTPDSLNKIPIIFRNTIPEIPSTTYGTFSIYKYPAKFIPQVIAYVLKEYALQIIGTERTNFNLCKGVYNE